MSHDTPTTCFGILLMCILLDDGRRRTMSCEAANNGTQEQHILSEGIRNKTIAKNKKLPS
jgi:hypothetical protein